ncbi:hypothetical protein [Nitratireductor indicus]|uniref:hypothetical protein n=1 Tax=Nitratireductor indicus TaxID=721133 RepID=UPI0028754BA6|nr:hypothetical protein [Nitratireductor indicus]MDS1135596.1 hypothetical protein [Nitratireductor indicus]
MTALPQSSSSQGRFAPPREAAPAVPAGIGSRVSAGTASFVSIRLSPAMAILLRALAAHDGHSSIERLIADMAEERAQECGVRRLFRSVLAAEREAKPRWPAGGAPEKSGGLRSQPCGAQTHNRESSVKGPEGVPRGALRSPP